MSKLEDVAVHGKAFVRGQSPEIKKWRQQLGHLLNNYLTFVMADLRSGGFPQSLLGIDPFPPPGSDPPQPRSHRISASVAALLVWEG